MKINKILIVDGTSRKDGFTKKLVDFLKNNVDLENIVTFETYKEKISFCDGCNFCEANERCKNRDLDVFFEEFETADLIVFATPVYNGMVSAPMKALIERFQPYYTYFYIQNKTQKIEKRRKAIILASAGRDAETALDYIVTQYKYAFSVTNIEFIGSVLCNFTDTSPNLSKAEEKIKNILERMDLQ
ncbi:MAG: flavodoxin family protein [Clostridia bacterium]|nr:flavodoxin family protein [Clostridia bacterium]